MSGRGMVGRIGLLLVTVGTGLLAAGCFEDYPNAESTGDAMADNWEAELLENEPSPKRNHGNRFG